jgi:hypothetical protein
LATPSEPERAIEARREPVACSQCVHYWVTHERTHPHGCRAFGFRSSRVPSHEIREASGRDCEAFERKERAK